MKLTEISLKNWLTVFILIILIVIIGSYSYISFPRESFPEVKIPFIIINTAYFGVSPSDIENLITQPIERELKGLDGMKEMRSMSSEGMSVVTVEFYPETDIDIAFQKVKTEVDKAKPDLPKDAEEPAVKELDFADFPIMMINLSGDFDIVRLKKIAEDMEEDIKTVPGVLDVKVVGGLEEEVIIYVDPAKLEHFKIPVTDVINSVRAENINIPGGNLKLGKYKYLIRIPAEAEEPSEIENWVVKEKDGANILVKDVADVVYGFKEKTSSSRLDGNTSVSLYVSKRTGENVIILADSVKDIIKDYEQTYRGRLRTAVVSDQSKVIKDMVTELENSILTSLVLVILVLMFAMGARNSLFVAVAIPLSMLMGFAVIYFMGYTLNMVLLFGLIMALGMLVDNAVVVVENIYRLRTQSQSPYNAALEGTSQVAMPVLASTLTTLAAFLPLLFFPGIMGQVMFFIPLSLIVILICSYIVAVIFNPMLCYKYMKVKHISDPDNDFILKRPYKKFLNFALGNSKKVIALMVTVFLITFIAYGILGKGVEFFPSMDPQQIMIDFTGPLGLQLDETDKVITEMENIVQHTPDMNHYLTAVGSKGASNPLQSGWDAENEGRIILDLADFEERGRSSRVTLDEIRKKTDKLNITGFDIVVAEQEQGPPTGKPVNIEIKGRDFKTLVELSEKVQKLISRIPGIINIDDDYEKGKPEITIRIDREKSGRLGLNTLMIAETVKTAIYGTTASKYRSGEDEYDITVKYRDEFKKSVEDVKNIKIFKEGNFIKLSEIAEVSFSSGYSSINRKDANRIVSVSGEAAEGFNADALRREAMKILDADLKKELPQGYSYDFTGEYEMQMEGQEFLTRAFIIALFLIALILITQFNSLILPFIIIFSVMLSLIGVLWGLIILQTPFGVIMTGIGVISLAGVVVNNSIVLLDFMEKLREQGYSKKEAIIEAASVRLRPVLLTSTTTVLGVVPMATGISFDFINFTVIWGSQTSQWWSGMSTALIFGLSFSTVLTLIVVPVMYNLLDKYRTLKPDISGS